MYAYDFVDLLAAAIVKAGSTDPSKIPAALEEVTTEGANGDERAFNKQTTTASSTTMSTSHGSTT